MVTKKDLGLDFELVCEDCGKKDPTTHKTLCPYAEEINDEKIEVTICDDCYTERCQDI